MIKTKNRVQERDLHLDMMKGISIILVVLGHTVQYANIEDFDNNVIFRIIYSFHMPLFMFLSGFLAYKNINGSFAKFIIKKIKNLVIPFLSWYFLVDFIIFRKIKTISFNDYFKNIIHNPDAGLWFFWVLFLNFILIYIVSHSKNYLEEILILCICIAIRYIPTNSYGVPLLIWHFPFFSAGYLLSKHKNRINIFSKYIKEISFIGFPLVIFEWNRVYYPSFASKFGDLFNIKDSYNIFLIYKYIVAFLGIAFVWYVIKAISKMKYSLVLSFIGKYTKDIYAIHYYFILFVNIQPNYPYIILTTLLAIVFSLFISYFIIRESKILKFLLLGI